MEAKFEELKGKTIVKIIGKKGGEVVEIFTSDNHKYKMCHEASCCECVYIDDIVGDFKDVLDSPILVAEESTNNDNPKKEKEYDSFIPDSFTWTFYKLATIKGFVDIKWYGTSNGYYSESVEFKRLQ